MRPNILFINLPSIPYVSIIESFHNNNKIMQDSVLPLGILYCSSYLKKYGHPGKVGLIDYSRHIANVGNFRDFNEFVVKIAENHKGFDADIIAFSLIYSISHLFYLKCLDVVKSFWPDATIVVGGTHAHNCAKHLLERKEADYVVKGEGELSFCDFVEQFSRSEEIYVKGVYSLRDIQSGNHLESGDYLMDLDEYPYPDWSLVDMGFYINKRGHERHIGDGTKRRSAEVMTTRGCYFKCTFCSSHTVHGRKMRYHSNENVIAEMRKLYETYGVTYFVVEDDLFTANRVRVISLLKAFKKAAIPGFKLECPNGLSVNTLNEEVCDALIDAGMNIFQLAIESGSKHVQKNIIKKNVNLQKAGDIVKYLKKRNITVRCYFILGFPGETKDMMLETINLAKNMEFDWSTFAVATPLIGTEMYNQFVEKGVISNELDYWSKSPFSSREFDTDEFTAEELNEFVYRVNLDVNFIHNPNLTNGHYEKALDIFNDILDAYPFHIIALSCLIKCYEGLKNFERAHEVKKKLLKLLENDKRSQDMYAKHSDLVPEEHVTVNSSV
jgi:radical SAM superfamily enzyme YgiQ (UPF0313 family)